MIVLLIPLIWYLIGLTALVIYLFASERYRRDITVSDIPNILGLSFLGPIVPFLQLIDFLNDNRKVIIKQKKDPNLTYYEHK